MSQKADTILLGTENEADAIVTLPGTWFSIHQGFSTFTFKFKGPIPNLNYHQRQKVRNNCFKKKTSFFYKHAYNFI